MMMFDDSWYGMRRHRGERGVFIPGEGFRAAPLPPWVTPEATPQPPMPVAQPEPVVPVQAPEGDLPPLKPAPKHAKDYLRRRLSGRVEVPAAVLFKDAAKYGFSPKMLRTAKNALKIRVFSAGSRVVVVADRGHLTLQKLTIITPKCAFQAIVITDSRGS
jgi:hypothetical protein